MWVSLIAGFVGQAMKPEQLNAQPFGPPPPANTGLEVAVGVAAFAAVGALVYWAVK